jgi:uncharacterized RDD family membrane protein YckC
MIFKRVLASSIDIAIALIIVLISLGPKVSIKYFLIFTLGFYLFHTTIYLIKNPNQTLGERILKIEVKYLKYQNKGIVVFRNLMFSILIFGTVIGSNNLFELFWMMPIPVLSLLPFGQNNINKFKFNGLDYLFKTEYKNWTLNKDIN